MQEIPDDQGLVQTWFFAQEPSNVERIGEGVDVTPEDTDGNVEFC